MAVAGEVEFVVGVDTHMDTHTAAVCDARGRAVAQFRVPASAAGYADLLARVRDAAGSGTVLWAMEGTRHYGLGLARYLTAEGQQVAEIENTRHVGRRRAGKSDPIDAVRAARELLARPQPGQMRCDGDREALRLLMVDRDNAVHSCKTARTVLTSVIVTAPEELREQLRSLTRDDRARACASLACPPGADRRTRVLHQTLIRLGQRIATLDQAAAGIEAEIAAIVEDLAPGLVAAEHGVGALSAAQILLSWSHAGRIRSEAAFAMLSGTLVTYLVEDEVTALLEACDLRSWTGRRDHAMFALTIRTGLRISELAGLTCEDVSLGRGANVHTLGKGRKERRTPLVPSTIRVLRAWLRGRGGAPADPLFPTSTGRCLSRDAVERRLAHHVTLAGTSCPSITAKRVSMHTLRHTAAMRLLLAEAASTPPRTGSLVLPRAPGRVQRQHPAQGRAPPPGPGDTERRAHQRDEPAPPPGDVPGDLGIMTSPAPGLADTAPKEALPPLFITTVLPGSPAASNGLRPGDIIVSVNDAPPFPDGIISEGVMNLLFGPYPPPGRVSMQLKRPATGRTWTVTLTPALYQAPPPPVSTKLLNGHIAYVQLPGFFPGSADQVLQAITGLATGAKLHGLILDLRGNGGGTVADPARLLGAFIHGAAWSYDCDVHGSCAARYTDSSVPLLHLPLVVLTDRNCVSACDAFSGAVKDLRLGTLVGTRTAGIVAGPAAAYLLDDASLLGFPARHDLGADHELINGIGVAPDYFIPLTAQDLSTGHDPDIAKALTLLGA